MSFWLLKGGGERSQSRRLFQKSRNYKKPVSFRGIVGRLLAAAVLFALGATAPVLAAPAKTAASPTAAPGTIAYVNQDNTELHLVQADGKNDHILWAAPVVDGVQSGLRYPAWRPDGAEVAFISDMEQATSLLQSDVFAIQPDKSGLRKLTDTPLNSNLGSFQVGDVDVQVTNVNLSDSVFIIYVEGAQSPQSATVPAGTSQTVTFQNVAIFPGKAQFPVAIDGLVRWFGQPDTPTFQPGTTNGASISISSGGYENFGAFNPTWRGDSAEIDYNLGQGCVTNAMAVNPVAGSEWGDPVVQFSASMCPLDRGPTTALNDQILYWDYLGNFPDGAFMQASEGASSPSMLFDTGYGSLVYGVKYLPDGSGFLYSINDGSCLCSNIYEYDFSSQQSNALTNFTQDYTGNLSISPDGSQVVFEHFDVDPNPTTNPDAVPDLWLMDRDGSGAGLFIQNARDPSWGQAAAAPLYTDFLYLPVIDK